MKKIKSIKGFVMNKKTGHPSYAFDQEKSIVDSVGFTHNKNDFSEKKKLKHNINPKDNEDCFVKIRIETQKYNNYRLISEYKDYRIHKDDLPLIESIINKHNKKRR